MNEDRILEMFFEKARWQYAIEKGLFKDMNKAVMYQLTTPEARLAMYQRIKSGNYKIMPPHTAKIPKDNGDFRTVYVNEAVDRILLSIANDLLFELMPEMVHPRCTSYQKGIGCGRVVQDVSRIIYSAEGKIIGWKGDFSKYFDSVPIRFIDWAFDKVEEKYGKSALIDVIRDYYHTDIYFDEDNNLCEKYQSLKQGCSVAAWLADVILYHLDNKNVMLDWWEENMFDDGSYAFSGNTYLGFIAGVPVMATVKSNVVELKCIPQPYRSTDKLDDFGNAVIRNLTEDECHLTTYMVPAYKQYIDDEREGDSKLLISFSIYEDEATISFHWNVPKD
jgi:hypothetical protein|nr:MAG TPA: Maturase reverse transcriptase/DNA/RNA Complex II intron, retroelement, retrotransposition [Caudoviricetes sp.]